MPHIGIVGAGIGGLHLGIHLCRHGVTTTIYADRSADELSQGRLLNTVMHHHLTLERERRLGIDPWSPEDDGWHHRHQYVDGSTPLRYSTSMPGPSMAIDYRRYLPMLMKEFENTGGMLEVRPVHVDEVDRLASRHDLLVVATSRGGMPLLFPIREDVPPIGVRRRICALLVEGIHRPVVEGVTLSFVPDVGELIEFPMLTADGSATALLFESVPGGPSDSRLSEHAGDPQSLGRAALDVVRQHYPQTAGRVDPQGFAIRGPRDIFVGAIAPAMRNGSTYLPCGRLAVALGDAHVLVDPLMGQGANIAAYSAEKVADAILTDLDFDEQFRRQLEANREPLLRAAYEWTNLQLDGPAHVTLIHRAAAANPDLASDFVGRYSDPTRMWQVLGTPTRATEYVRRHGDELAASIEEDT